MYAQFDSQMAMTVLLFKKKKPKIRFFYFSYIFKLIYIYSLKYNKNLKITMAVDEKCLK